MEEKDDVKGLVSVTEPREGMLWNGEYYILIYKGGEDEAEQAQLFYEHRKWLLNELAYYGEEYSVRFSDDISYTATLPIELIERIRRCPEVYAIIKCEKKNSYVALSRSLL